MVKRATGYATPTDIDALGVAWVADIRGRVRPRPELVLKPSSTALVVVDMVRYFADPTGRAFLPASLAVAHQLAGLLPHWRRAGGRVVFTRHGHDGPEDTGMLGRFFSDYIQWDSDDSKLIPDLQPARQDLVLRKRTYDAFWETDLESWLAGAGCTQVLLAGVLTHMCVATTARSAFVRGLEPHLLVDGTASSTLELHLAALHTLADSVALCHTCREVVDQCC